MSRLTANDKRILEKVFQMEEGYVLNFSNRTFADFFESNYGIDIYDDKYYGWSGSKASRMRAFWDLEDDSKVARLILDLLKYVGNEIILENLKMRDFPNRLVIRAGDIAKSLIEEEKDNETDSDNEYLEKDFSDIKKIVEKNNKLTHEVILQRLNEAQICIDNKCPLAAIFLIASTLEGVLMEEAKVNSQLVMKSTKVPRDKEKKVIPIDKWMLKSLIDVTTDVGIINKNASRFGVQLMGVRNFIHPMEQLRQRFNPDLHTAKISLQVLMSCLDDINNFRKRGNENNIEKQ